MELPLINFYRFVVNIMRCILPFFFFPRFGEVQGFWFSCCWACFIQLHSDQGAQGYLCPCSLPFWRGSCNMKNKEAYAFKEKNKKTCIKDWVLKLDIEEMSFQCLVATLQTSHKDR